MANNVVKVLAYFCFICGTPALFSQSTTIVLHGTIVLVLRENDRIIIAADSMTKEELGKAKPTYNACKINRLGNSTFFSATGRIFLGDKKGRERVFVFKAHDLSKQAFARFKEEPNTDARTKRMAKFWGNSICNRLRAYVANGHHVPSDPDGQILSGIFVSALAGTDWSIYRVTIMTQPSKSRKSLQTFTAQVEPSTFPVGSAAELGVDYHELIAEFMSEQTARSIKANKKMRDILQSNPTIDVDAFRLESIIAALEEWTGPDVDIGGEIDVLELTRNSTHWLRVKDECRDQ